MRRRHKRIHAELVWVAEHPIADPDPDRGPFDRYPVALHKAAVACPPWRVRFGLWVRHVVRGGRRG